MFKQHGHAAAYSVVLAIFISAQALAQPASNPPTTTTLGVQVALPPAYQSTLASLGALATSGTAALKTYRSDARTLAIRSALTAKLLAAGTTATTINLDKLNSNPALGEIAILCNPRQNYITNSVSLSYVNALVQSVKSVGTKADKPSDIIGALKLLFASTSYSIVDDVKIDDDSLNNLGTTALSNCKADLQSYEKNYYGAAIEASGAAGKAAAPAAGGAAPSDVTTFAFLGPIGTLIDTFISIVQPVIIDASVVADEANRQRAIVTAFSDHDTEVKIEKTGRALAIAVDNYAASSRQNLAGSFVEQLVALRGMTVDLSGEPDCKNMLPGTRLPSGAPNAAFIGCWRAAWAKLQPQVTSLTAIGDNYDNLADAGGVNTRKLLGTILADYKLIRSGATDPQNLTLFASDVTEFITFANAVAAAASKTNITTLKKEAAQVSK